MCTRDLFLIMLRDHSVKNTLRTKILTKLVHLNNSCLKCQKLSFLDIMDEKRSIGERGPDKEKRDFNKKSLFNLKQFQKPVPNVGTSVDPAANTGVNWSKLGKIAIVVIVISALIWKLYQRKKHSEDTKQES